MRTIMVRTTLATVLSVLVSGQSHAEPAPLAPMPALTAGHPRLYGTQADFDRLKRDLAIGPDRFPVRKGRITFTLNASNKAPGDTDKTDLFGSVGLATGERIAIRHGDLSTNAGVIDLQVAFGPPAGGTSWVWFVQPNVPANTDTEIDLSWEVGKQATLRVGGNVYTKSLVGETWSPKEQQFTFDGHKADRITQFKLFGENDEIVWESPAVDVNLHRAWRRTTYGYKDIAAKVARALVACDTTLPIAQQTKDCLAYTTGGRETIIDATARKIGLAYLMTKDDLFLNAIRTHARLMLQVDKAAGAEWDMAGRVGAMGLYYDWLHDRRDESFIGNTTFGEALAGSIKATIATTIPNSVMDLVHAACGKQALTASTGNFNCAKTPTYVEWSRASGDPSVSEFYLGGHPQSALASMALGLIAIADQNEHPEALPLLETIYDHDRQGFLRARDFVAPNGGSHMLFAYAASSGGDLAERLVLWQRALGGSSGLHTIALGQFIHPYIYGLRHDGTFPARGDNFDFGVTFDTVGQMALAAVAETGDQNALAFYRQQVLGTRAPNHITAVWENLLFPGLANATPTGVDVLPLSRKFDKAGNVLIRDTWNYPNATLLEFKSTSFISENHQHLDQNSFSLNYKAPLLIDSGQYDDYGTVHWKNYYQRTVAHNGIVVFDPTERFDYGVYTAEPWSNDGGQWYGTVLPTSGRQYYPTIEEAKTVNFLDGVTAYQDVAGFAVVTGNASKAYASSKLDQTAGFVRTMVYVRNDTDGSTAPVPPTIVVFDSVRTKNALKATSLLHMVDKPATLQEPTASSEPGHYTYPFASGNAAYTVRNGNGMVTVQTLLPADGKVELVGGLNYQGRTCAQIVGVKQADGSIKPQDGGTNGDCRFLARKVSNGTVGWYNYPPASATGASGDVGSWRLETTSGTAPAAGAPQYFLNVLHVANGDARTGVAQYNPAAVVRSSAGVTAVRLASGETLVFVDAAIPAAQRSWSGSGKTLVVGLKPNTGYVIGTTGDMVTLTEGVPATKTSSADGIVVLN